MTVRLCFWNPETDKFATMALAKSWSIADGTCLAWETTSFFYLFFLHSLWTKGNILLGIELLNPLFTLPSSLNGDRLTSWRFTNPAIWKCNCWCQTACMCLSWGLILKYTLESRGMWPDWARPKSLKPGQDGPFCHVHIGESQAVPNSHYVP